MDGRRREEQGRQEGPRPAKLKFMAAIAIAFAAVAMKSAI